MSVRLQPLGLGWPNVVSILRVVLAPALVVLIAVGADIAAAVVFAVGAVSDRLDGYLARRYAAETPTGEWLDPLADKLFLAAALIPLSAAARFPAWAATVILVREIGITVLRIRLGNRGVSMPASPAAKWKTGVQQFAILLYLIPEAIRTLDPAPYAFLVFAVALTVWSAIEYVAAARKTLAPTGKAG